MGTGSKDRVWWKCEKGHEWQARVIQRNAGTGCPICANRVILKSYNDFATEHPELLKEWDYQRNSINPSDCACFSNQRVWWICKRGHQWKAAIGDRSKGTGCPRCSEERRVSFPEKAVLYYLRKHVKNVQANYREKEISPYELDIYLPDYRLAIEYDGIYGHSKEKGIQRDIRKNLVCKENRITLIRIREEGCPILNSSSVDLMIKGRNDLADAIHDLFSYLMVNFGLNTMFKAPQIAKMWHPTKNGCMNPEYVSSGSNKKVWWLGECGHEWVSMVSYEVSSGKCPYCSGMRVLQGFNDLATVNPKLAKEWDFGKNEKLRPEQITTGSGKKIWWKCELVHSWQASMVSRNRGNGCPICANRIALKDYNDITSNEKLYESWHFEKNVGLNPAEISVGSEKRVWWLCPECGYEWRAMVRRRTDGNGCPECGKRIRSANSRKRMVLERGSLADRNPALLEEWDWDYDNNPNLNHDFLTAGSGKRVNWKCHICGNKWDAVIGERTRGRGKCRACEGATAEKKR